MSKFLHSKFTSLTPYDTSEEVESMKGYIRLNTNESPFPPSPIAIAYAYKAAEGLNYYPDPDCRRLAETIAGRNGIKPSNIVFGNGSDEILSFIFMALCEKGAAFPDITYSFYKILAGLHGVNFTTIPLRGFKILTEDYTNLEGRTVFIANPNAPTSLALDTGELELIISSNPDSLIVVDEAYVDFGAKSAVRFIRKYDNLIVVRTFSKSRSLAGARLGWCMCCDELAADIRAVKNAIAPYNVNAMTQAAALGSLEDEDYTRRNIAMICKVRDNTASRLREMGFEVLDSSTNFLFAKHSRAAGVKIYEALKKYKIIIRHFSSPLVLDDWNRITIGTAEQMQVFLEVVKGVVERESR
ncbi:MAG: histidinol-phosphate transaminase [Synergistaceae bacterium]|nr:histidinol-phosphate transaminase [Synergistaceae bacterium]